MKHYITVTLTQEEFDPLVSLGFNIGVKNFSKSQVITEINQGGYMAGAAKDCKAAIDTIKAAFGKHNKSGCKVLIRD